MTAESPATADTHCRHCTTRRANARLGLCTACCNQPAVRQQYAVPDPPAATSCRHCKRGKVNRPRGLCLRCYYTPGVKDLYPSTSKYARRGVMNVAGVPPEPEPTAAWPGTPEKLSVLEARAAAGQSLFHSLDADMPTLLHRLRSQVVRRSPEDRPVYRVVGCPGLARRPAESRRATGGVPS